MNATVMCEKCGKPLGVFDGNTCADCSKIEQIRDEISELSYVDDIEITYGILEEAISKEQVLKVINKYMKGGEKNE